MGKITIDFRKDVAAQMRSAANEEGRTVPSWLKRCIAIWLHIRNLRKTKGHPPLCLKVCHRDTGDEHEIIDLTA